ncbi:toll/interleukin-1 receptor domain-containing protein [Paenarthrobacter sp. NPDC090522]|uniref:toll/interleukin-1 receptor domain-containing protein n=1 Tax=Paenarthrobacter sp. NPDC090522 TaxID=3364383 RepID=UPI0038026175
MFLPHYVVPTARYLTRERLLQVFISWSGKQSHTVALALRNWLPLVLDNKIEPFVSSEDIGKGDRGLNKIAKQLEDSSYGIVVVTPTNQNSPWINFEAGALGKVVSDSKVAPLLVGLTDSDVSGPIKQFQNTEATDSKAVLSLVRTLNGALDDSLSDGTVEVLFEKHWPQFEQAVTLLKPEAAPQPPRKEADLLDEVLTTVRSLQRDVVRMQKLIETSGRRRPEAAVIASDNLENDLLERLTPELKIVGADISSTVDGVKIVFQPNAGTVSGSTLRALEKLAKAHQRSVRLEASDGSYVSFSADGIQSRSPEDATT